MPITPPDAQVQRLRIAENKLELWDSDGKSTVISYEPALLIGGVLQLKTPDDENELGSSSRFWVRRGKLQWSGSSDLVLNFRKPGTKSRGVDWAKVVPIRQLNPLVALGAGVESAGSASPRAAARATLKALKRRDLEALAPDPPAEHSE
ncbi:MAG: hypothetical protein JKY65_05835 [Planctomycetes bacterium]|nr:hypothetical protein [Planctomycetota bacterium]